MGVVSGVTATDALAETGPMPWSIVTPVDPVTVQERVTDAPGVLGLAPVKLVMTGGGVPPDEPPGPPPKVPSPPVGNPQIDI